MEKHSEYGVCILRFLGKKRLFGIATWSDDFLSYVER